MIGGIGSIPGAMAGGLILGFAEAFTQGYISTRWSDLRRLRDPDPLHALPPDRACSARRTSRRYERERKRPTRAGGRPPAPAVGQDEWVARTASAAAAAAGGSGASKQRLRVVPWWAWLILFVAIVAPLPLVSDSGYVRRVAFDTVLYMLLALGLNVVVGWGGLLDLGYVAFYGVGAYAYAILASDQLGMHLPTLVSIPLVVVIGAHRRACSSGCPRDASSATTWRS